MPILKSLVCGLLCLSWSLHASAADPDPDSLELPMPQVLTPVRLKQPRTEVPASVTVIDRELIAASGIRELPELLRLVPGMSVGARSGWDYVVSYHGTNRRNSRRMRVLIDGRSVYQAGFATIDWADLPVALEDIERIEVVRGPDTAAYGANAFLGIINIITQHPDDSPQLRLKATNGNKSTEDYYASTSQHFANSSYRITATTHRDSGFDHNEENLDRRDSESGRIINGRWLYAPSTEWLIDFQAGYKTGIKTEDITDESMQTSPDHWVKDYFVSVNSQHFLAPDNSLKWQLDATRNNATTEWTSCAPAFYLGIPSVANVCGDANENSTNTRIDFDLQDTLLGAAPWKLVTGAHVQQQNVDSATYYNGKVYRSTYQLFSDFEYRFLPQWSATLAGSQEYLTDGNQNFSPRAALLFFPSENQSIRAVYSEAIRSPDLFENEADWSYTVRNLNPVLNGKSQALLIQQTESPGNLIEEKIRSHELGYYSLWFNRRLELDVKTYVDDLSNLISENLTFNNFKPTNGTSLRQQGYEAEGNFYVSEQLRLRFDYALINSDAVSHNNKNRNVGNEQDLTPHNSGSVGFNYKMPQEWQLASFYYYACPINNNKFSRWDGRIAKRLPMFATHVTLSAVIQHYYNKTADLFDDNQYNGPNRFYLSADLTF